MLIEIKKEEEKQYVVCPLNGAARFVPYCRKHCKMFKGYKTTENWQRHIKCEYKNKPA